MTDFTGKEWREKMSRPIRIIIVGMGVRSMIYAREALEHPDLFQVVGVADINPERVRTARETFGIPKEHCFSSVEELVAVPKFADGIINGTMDQQHVPTSLPLLRHGYDILLEKPFAVNLQEAEQLIECEHETGRRVMVCHVLRYAPFYRRIKEIITGGEIGRVVDIRMAEQVSYFHESVSYVRGKYASPEICGSGMLLSKSCHDIDIMTWLMRGNHPVSVSSVGSVFQFKPQMAPEGAGTHCLVDCPIERTCPYSAKCLYIEHPQRWTGNIWHDIGYEKISEEEKIALLSDPENPFSRCVYRCDLKIVDHQSLLVSFTDGATGTFSMNGGATASGRHIHITGTKGEILGTFEEGRFTVYRIAPDAPGGRTAEVVDVSGAQHGNAHGGGDQAIIHDFITLLQGGEPSPCCTTLDDSMTGHRVVFLAEESRKKNGAAFLI